MADLPSPLERLAAHLVRMPGIGRRTAERLAYFLARSPREEVVAFGESIASLPDDLLSCTICGNLSGEKTCGLCRDARRDRTLLCVVEQPENVAAIDRTGAYSGLYHVLGGAISPLRSIGPDDLRVGGLLDRLGSGEFKEVILATNPTVEGEATAIFLARKIAPLGVTATRPATGLPVGGELDYIDRSTLARAFEGRRDISS